MKYKLTHPEEHPELEQKITHSEYLKLPFSQRGLYVKIPTAVAIIGVEPHLRASHPTDTEPKEE